MLKFSRIIALFIIVVCACSVPDQEQIQQSKTESQDEQAQPAAKTISELTKDDTVAVITTDYGNIVFRFFPNFAPEHVLNFKQLAASNFYDGTTFHRVIPGFMIQGGDPNSRDDNPGNDGHGDGPRKLKAEFSTIPFERGTIGMARNGMNPHSGSCQFFICVARRRDLDRNYTAFGKVLDGMGAVDMIVNLPTGLDGMPSNQGANPGQAAVIRKIRLARAGDVLDFSLNQ